MVSIERLEDWRGQQVFDRDGESLGKLDEIYYDAASGRPVLIAVKSGLLGRKSSLIPLEGTTAGRDYLHVAHNKATVEAAGDLASGGNPTREELASLGDAYGARFAADSQLESASEIETRRAEADAARQRSREAAEEEQARLADRDLAAERAKQASAEAAAADQAANQAHQAADDARREAERHHRE